MKQFRRELKRLLPSVIFSITVFSLLVYPGVVSGDEPGELDDKLEETVQEIEQAEGEKFSTEEELEQARLREEQLAGSISYYEFQLSLAQQQLKKLGDDITEKEAAIADNLRNAQLKLEQVIGYKQNLFSQARELYKSYFANSLEIYFLTPDELEGARLMILHQAVIENLRQEVYFLNDQVKELEGERFSLEGERKNLQADRDILVDQKQETEVSIDTAQKKVLAARSDQQQLMQHLAGLGNRLQELTKKEQQILAQKAAAALAATTVGEIEITRSAIVGPPPQDSNVYFSFWTYGYPHRVGMNQYGAYGRAKAGQGYKEILGKYYSLSPEAIVPYQASETIHVLGCQYGPPPWVEGGKSREVCESEGGTFYDTRIDFEEYIKGLGEMPSSWGSPDNAGMEALKAQAVAARSYVLYYTADGSSPICPSTNCQYYTGSNKGGYWEEAVNATNAEVILYENKPISAYYHSTSGGYTLNSEEVWTSPRPYLKGIRDVDAQGHYYDEISPWYHKAWGDQPWLSRDQVEDLLNAALLPESYNAYLPMPSAEEAQKPLTERGGGFTPEEILATLQKESVDSITNLKSLEVIGAEGKSTLLVRVYYEQGYIDIDAQRFRFVFNLRSPGTDAIWTSRFDIRTS